ncbi:hypothetical protein [Deinococcus hopiensis]|nr:hypothetical protein [Deinococcus hopiensis]
MDTSWRTTRVETGQVRMSYSTTNWGSLTLRVGSSEGVEATTLQQWREQTGAEVTETYPLSMR